MRTDGTQRYIDSGEYEGEYPPRMFETTGREAADEIIRKRLLKCLRDGKGHLVYVDGRGCSRCGINRIFHLISEHWQTESPIRTSYIMYRDVVLLD